MMFTRQSICFDKKVNQSMEKKHRNSVTVFYINYYSDVVLGVCLLAVNISWKKLLLCC